MREGLYGLVALIKRRESDWAREKAQAMVRTLGALTDESGKWELPGEVLGRLKRSRSDDADHRRALHDRFFANVERLRVERGLLTQRAFADACGLHQSQVSRMEKLRASNPSYLPRLAVRDKIARGLDVSLAELEA